MVASKDKFGWYKRKKTYLYASPKFSYTQSVLQYSSLSNFFHQLHLTWVKFHRHSTVPIFLSCSQSQHYWYANKCRASTYQNLSIIPYLLWHTYQLHVGYNIDCWLYALITEQSWKQGWETHWWNKSHNYKI